MSFRLFQIGFNRCGTMSIAKLFRANGYRAAHWQGGRLAAAIELARRRGEPLLTHVGDYQVFTDMELRGMPELRKKWLPRRVFRRLFRELERTGEWQPVYAYKYFDLLDAQYPGSKFLLNTRDMNGWVESRFRFKDDYRACVHGDVAHGSESELVACWTQDWESHHAQVRAHFEGRPEDLLELDIERDDIQKLVDFVAPMGLDPSSWLRHNASRSHATDTSTTSSAG